MKLNIRDEKGTVIKAYETEEVRIPYKIIRRFVKIIDLDKIQGGDEIGIAGMVLQCMEPFENLVKSIFPDLTDDELDQVDIMDFVPLFKELLQFVVDKVNSLPKEKN